MQIAHTLQLGFVEFFINSLALLSSYRTTLILSRGAQLKSRGGPKIFFYPMAKVIFLNTFKGCFYQRKKQNKQNLGFCVQNLALGLYFAHARSKAMFLNRLDTMNFLSDFNIQVYFFSFFMGYKLSKVENH